MSTVFYIDRADLRRGSRARAAEIVKCPLRVLTTTTPISAEGRARAAEIVKCPQFFNVDRADPRRGLIFVERCRPYPAALRREERILKLLS